MKNFEKRTIEAHQLPINRKTSLLHPERVVLQYYKSHSIDFGALCYLRRPLGGRRLPNEPRPVDLSSYDEERAARIRAFINFVSTDVESNTSRIITLDTQHRVFVKFIDWCDHNGHSNILSNETACRVAFRDYVHDLQRLVSQHQLGNNTAAIYQNTCQKILEEFLDIENLDRGINKLAKRMVFDTPTPVPDDDAQGKVIAWCQTLFTGLSSLVIEHKCYPHGISLPAYLNWPIDTLWIFPGQEWCRTPVSTHNRKKVPLDYISHNYATGEVFSLEDLLNAHGSTATRKQLCKVRTRALSQIRKANSDPRFRHRLDRGQIALRFFMILFVAATGMNPFQAIALPWSSEFDDALNNPSVERQGFRTIKYRANNKVVSFEIGIKFMPYFKMFLNLRKYLLDGTVHDTLFIGLQRNNLSIPVTMSADIFARTYKILHQIDPSIPKVMPREWRAAKQDYLVRNTDPITAARLMQHSTATALKKYSNGSEVVQQTELHQFLTNVEKVVLEANAIVDHGEPHAIGICSSPKNPIPISDHQPIVPDCKGPESCLFCDQYRAHADETDTRKLLSARYCIRKTSQLANSYEQFERVFGVVLNRIEFILGEIRRREETLVEKIEHEVDIEGELDIYWSLKLETLMELDLI